jgi:hypothetical protein
MTAADRARQINTVSGELLAYLREHGTPTSAGDLLRRYCQEHGIDLALAEVALSLLLNQRLVVANRDMQLTASKEAAYGDA